MDGVTPTRVCLVGSGTRFLSGISYYTTRLSNALATKFNVSVILMRQLLPTRFYPGRDRVGTDLVQMDYDSSIRVFDGVDWYWIPTIFQATRLLTRERPHVVVFQWWSGTVLHSYLALALFGRLLGARTLVEFHELLDVGEMALALPRMYANLVALLLVGIADGFVVHSEYDKNRVAHRYRLGDRPVIVIPHGPYDQYGTGDAPPVLREAPPSCCNLLFFGVIRPFKGLEDLIKAFDGIPEDQIGEYWLTVVGEPWENWTKPLEQIEQSPHRNRITLVDRYVADAEVAGFFAGADAVILPYRRSSASGPLHVAMSMGLPTIVTRVGGLPEAVEGYEGIILVPPGDADAIRAGMARLREWKGKRFADPHNWERTIESYDGLISRLADGRGGIGDVGKSRVPEEWGASV